MVRVKTKASFKRWLFCVKLGKKETGLGLLFLAHDTDALGAHVLANHTTIFKNLNTLDVRLEHPVGSTVGVADIVPK